MDKIYELILRLGDSGEGIEDMQVIPPDQYIMNHAKITGQNGTTYKYLLDYDKWNLEYRFYYQVLKGLSEDRDEYADSWEIEIQSMPLDERLRLSLTGLEKLKEQIISDLDKLNEYSRACYSKEIACYRLLVQEIDAVTVLIDYYTAKGTISTQTLDAAISALTPPPVSNLDYPQQVKFAPELVIGNIDDDWKHTEQATELDFLTDSQAFLEASESLMRVDQEEYWAGSYYRIHNDVQMVLTILHFCQIHKIKLLRCRNCGKVFIVTSKHRKYCSDVCYEIGDSANKKAYDERNKAEKKAKQRVKNYYRRHIYDFPIEILRLPHDIDPEIEKTITQAIKNYNSEKFNSGIGMLFGYQKKLFLNGVLSDKDYFMWVNNVGRVIKM